MSRLYSRMKGALHDAYSRRTPYGSSVESNNENERKSPIESEKDDDDSHSEKQSIRNLPRERTPTPTPIAPPVRTISYNQIPNPPPQQPTQPPVRLAPQQQIPPPVKSIIQPAIHDPPPPIRTRPQRSFMVNPNSTLVGFPRTEKFSSFSQFRPNFSRRFQTPTQQRSQQQNIISTRNIDYPIEDIIFEDQIPSSLAHKVNEAVEHDRYGRIHHTEHYVYNPQTQHRSREKNLTGRRYIREIIPSQRDICYNIPELSFYSGPVHHFIADALPNDPMRYYY